MLAGALASTGCATYEYEEEIFLEVDGSGRIRVSGSSEILTALHELDRTGASSTAAAMSSRFDAPGLEIESVRETERDGRRFVHVQGTFAAWNGLCRHPAFAERDCRLESTDDEALQLLFGLPASPTSLPDGVDDDAPLALRFHFPSTVSYHNSPGGIERGNIIEWERTAAEHFGGADLVVEATFERRSVLATTVVVLGMAIAAVVLSVALALFLMVRKGRRQLALEAADTLDAQASIAQKQ